MLVIFILSAQSTVPQAPSVPGALTAIAGHLVAYAMLAVLLAIGLVRVVQSLQWRMVIAFLISVAYGISDEFHQSFVPGRDASLMDVATDAIGAAIGLWLLYMFVRRRSQHRIRA